MLRALGYDDQLNLKDSVKLAASVKDGFLTWGEFLDFFFLRDATAQDRMDGDDWWNKLDPQGRAMPADEAPLDAQEGEEAEEQDQANASGKDKVLLGGPTPLQQREALERAPVEMTGSLQLLQDSRAMRTVREVQDEFLAKLAADKRLSAGKDMSKPKKEAEYSGMQMMADGSDDEDGGGLFQREKSKNLLLGSQIEVMHQVFLRMDKYEEGILRRQEFVMALRTDGDVIDFIDCDAVKKAYSQTTLTLDAVLMEIERDESYEQGPGGKPNEINHKEFITWREFLTYFNDYREIEERNKKGGAMGVDLK